MINIRISFDNGDYLYTTFDGTFEQAQKHWDHMYCMVMDKWVTVVGVTLVTVQNYGRDNK